MIDCVLPLAGLAPTLLPPFRGSGRIYVAERWFAC
jgi:hypothetical protein